MFDSHFTDTNRLDSAYTPPQVGWSKETNMTTELKVEGMTCNNCVRHVREALESVSGVEKVEVSLDTGRATVHGNASIAKLIEAVSEEGYSAQTQ